MSVFFGMVVSAVVGYTIVDGARTLAGDNRVLLGLVFVGALVTGLVIPDRRRLHAND
jgi:high-affinity Fe2+/Pb2+ permease